ncbi:hypothetical protein C6497_11585 [Candidatus Poribacteria bacterium]|nr:MAG: hypothetical protein C6497_11585 [Candidatus Poribacteria bacterium]
MNILQNIPIILFILLTIGCGKVRLTQISKSTEALQLTEKQKNIIHPKLKLIQDVLDDYDFEKRQIESDLREYRTMTQDRQLYRYDGGLSTAQRQRRLSNVRIKVRKFLTHRNVLLKEIGKLLQEITNELTDEQRIVFNELKLPELEIPRSLRRDPTADFRYIPSNPLGIR